MNQTSAHMYVSSNSKDILQNIGLDDIFKYLE